MMIVELVFEGEFPTLNKVIALSKDHYGSYSRVKKEYTEMIHWDCKKYPRPPTLTKPVKISFVWHRKDRRHDPDNVMVGSKFILDGLVKAKVLQGDGWRHIVELNHGFRLDKKNPRVEVRLEEVE